MNKLSKIALGSISTLAIISLTTNLITYIGHKRIFKETENSKGRSEAIKEAKETSQEVIFPESIFTYGAKLAANHYLQKINQN